MQRFPFFMALFAVLATAPALQARTVGYTGPKAATGYNVCHGIIERVERSYGIPSKLLESIALTESGRTYQGKYIAWPWTVMAEGKGRYFNSKNEAISEVQKLQAKGIKNIDMGCMQVNLKYHGKHFGGSIHRMLDPFQNVAYAAKYLTNLQAEAGLWRVAVGQYHSKTPSRREWYQSKVFSRWRKQRGLPVEGATAKQVAAYTNSQQQQLQRLVQYNEEFLERRRNARIKVLRYGQ